MHLVKEQGEYLLFDNNTVSIYRLSEEQGRELEKLTDAGIDRLLGADKASKTQKISREKSLPDCKHADRIILVISQVCNMGCKYCYAQQGSYGEENKYLMTFDTLKSAVKKALEIYPEGVSKIQFFGGEPLMNFSLMKKATPWIVRFFEEQHLEIPQFTIVTNGTLITPEINDFFNEYHVNVTISIDGNKEVNDINRVFKNSQDSTYETIFKNIQYINRHRNYILMLEMTVDRANYLQFRENGDRLIDIEKLLDFKSDLFHIVPAIWPKGYECGFELEENTELMKEYFTSVAQLVTKQFGTDRPFNVIKIADMVRELIQKKKKHRLCGAGIDQFSVDVNGDMYPCFAFIGQHDFKMGNVLEEDRFQFESVRNVCQNNTFDQIEECKNCWANGLCSNCIGNSLLVHGRIDKPIKELCDVQKATLEQTIVACYKMVSHSEVTE